MNIRSIFLSLCAIFMVMPAQAAPDNQLLDNTVSLLQKLAVWCVNSVPWLDNPLGKRFAEFVISVLLALALAGMVWHLISNMMERYLDGTYKDGVKVVRSARVRTLFPMFRHGLKIVMIIIMVLVVMSEMGIDVTPLLAGAGVLGIAVGFGSQALVKDFLTGLFIILEDSISVGDYLTIGSHTGTVEMMTIRTIKLRDNHGGLHVLPFGEVTSFINHTKDYAYALVDIGVSYDGNLRHIIATLRDLGEQLCADPEFGPMIIEPIEVLGLESFNDSSITIRSRFKTLPQDHWAVRREFSLRLKERFDAEKIEIPYPVVKNILVKPENT